MAVPKKKTSKSRRNMRRAHDSLIPMSPTECPNCGALRLSHHVCASCGFYRNREVIKIESESAEEEAQT
jgi:large subunit ribosomal protein L32